MTCSELMAYLMQWLATERMLNVAFGPYWSEPMQHLIDLKLVKLAKYSTPAFEILPCL